MFTRPSALLLPAMASSVAVGATSVRNRCQLSTCSGTTASPAGSLLRVATYNVRRFKGADGQSSVSAIADTLARLQPTVVALNEVDIGLRPEALESLAQKLGGFSVAFFGHVRGKYGNALLSKYPIIAIRETHLRGGTEVGFPAGTKKFNGEIAKEGELHRIGRGLLECDIQLPADNASRVLTIAVTHLDHISEDQRNVQLSHVLEALGTNSHRSLLIGDLNALSRSDYSADEWRTLEERAVANGWVGPASGCLDKLHSSGFVDAFAASRGCGALSDRPDSGADPIFSAHVGHPLYRIDYCFVAAASGLTPLAAAVHTSVQLSDHFPVTFDFRVLGADARL